MEQSVTPPCLNRFRALFCMVSALVLPGCASITSVAVDPTNGKQRPNAAEGILYYMPAPYLLVTEVPVEVATSGGGKEGGGAPPAGVGGDGKGAAKDDGSKPAAATDAGSGTSPSPSSDASYGMFTKQYGVKLIYLPDLSNPRVLQQRSGIGTTTLKPTLVDGWMLTSLDSSADSKTAETLASVGSILSGAMGAGSAAKGASATSKAGGAAPVPSKEVRALPPGLYKFQFNNDGTLKGLCQVARFADTGVEAPKQEQKCN